MHGFDAMHATVLYPTNVESSNTMHITKIQDHIINPTHHPIANTTSIYSHPHTQPPPVRCMMIATNAYLDPSCLLAHTRPSRSLRVCTQTPNSTKSLRIHQKTHIHNHQYTRPSIILFFVVLLYSRGSKGLITLFSPVDYLVLRPSAETMGLQSFQCRGNVTTCCDGIPTLCNLDPTNISYNVPHYSLMPSSQDDQLIDRCHSTVRFLYKVPNCSVQSNVVCKESMESLEMNGSRRSTHSFSRMSLHRFACICLPPRSPSPSDQLIHHPTKHQLPFLASSYPSWFLLAS